MTDLQIGRILSVSWAVSVRLGKQIDVDTEAGHRYQRSNTSVSKDGFGRVRCINVMKGSGA